MQTKVIKATQNIMRDQIEKPRTWSFQYVSNESRKWLAAQPHSTPTHSHRWRYTRDTGSSLDTGEGSVHVGLLCLPVQCLQMAAVARNCKSCIPLNYKFCCYACRTSNIGIYSLDSGRLESISFAQVCTCGSALGSSDVIFCPTVVFRFFYVTLCESLS